MSTPETPSASVMLASARVRQLLMESKGAAQMQPGDIALHVASMIAHLMQAMAGMSGLTNWERKDALLSGLRDFLLIDCGIPEQECDGICLTAGLTVDAIYAAATGEVSVVAKDLAKGCCSAQ